jgi:5-formyltetrahydrofolate cyclo-ligase
VTEPDPLSDVSNSPAQPVLGTAKTAKAYLRRSLLNQRQALPIAEWRQLSDRLCQQLQTHPLLTQAQTILAYFSSRQEPDLSPLFTLSYQWGFPRCVGKTLAWHCWSPNSPLQRNRFNILEPLPDAPTLEAQDVDLLLLPAVACDQYGYRLGYGGGFYDRLFSNPEWASKPAIGIVFDFAFLPQLPIESWDQPLQGVCTETGIKLISSKPIAE